MRFQDRAWTPKDTRLVLVALLIVENRYTECTRPVLWLNKVGIALIDWWEGQDATGV